jgi:hypothetical protein
MENGAAVLSRLKFSDFTRALITHIRALVAVSFRDVRRTHPDVPFRARSTPGHDVKDFGVAGSADDAGVFRQVALVQ